MEDDMRWNPNDDSIVFNPLSSRYAQAYINAYMNAHMNAHMNAYMYAYPFHLQLSFTVVARS